MKKKGIQIAMVIGGIIFALIFLELGSRLIPLPASRYKNYYSDDGLFTCSASTGWAGQPNYSGLYAREEFSHQVQFNSRGLYDTEHAFEKPNNTFRILWVGDSFAQALQVKEEQTAHQQLENLLNERLGNADRSFEVISTGMVGWGTGHQLIYYNEQGHKYQPDLVLLFFYMGNDVLDALPGEAFTIDNFNCFAPYFPICSDDTLSTEAWHYVPGIDPAWNHCSTPYKWLTSTLGFFQRNSYLFAQIEPLLISLKERRVYGNEFGHSYAALYLDEESEEVSYGWRVVEKLMKRFDQTAKKDGAKFAVALIGPREVIWMSQLTTEQQQVFYQSSPAFEGAKIDRPNQRLLTFFQSQNIPALDLQQPMIDHIATTGAELYFPIDRHWNADGNRFAAELVYNWLIERNLLE